MLFGNYFPIYFTTTLVYGLARRFVIEFGNKLIIKKAKRKTHVIFGRIA